MKPQPSANVRRYSIGTAHFEPEKLMPGLYVVATPIGNLGDVTVRALATLAAADTIFCEDTRTTARLLDRYGIRTKLLPYHEHNAAKVRPGIVAALREGAAFALVSDAGMPLVSDPGYRLVAEALAVGCRVTACPGPSAVLTALALSGLPTDRFCFLGFLPHRAGERQRLLTEFVAVRSTLIVFESPSRILDCLEDIERIMPQRSVALARELTKLHEEILRGPPPEVRDALAGRPAIKGEITLVISPPAAKSQKASDDEISAAIAAALETLPAGRAAAEVARRLGLDRKTVYARILAGRNRDGE